MIFLKLRAFTLIELMVSIVAAVTITGAALGVLIVIAQTQREVEERAQLGRDAQLAIDMLEYDLSFYGAAAPRRLRVAPTGFTGAEPTHQLRPPLRIGQPDNLVFVGDLPTPDAELTGVVKLVDEDVNGDGEVMLASELCPCVPEAALPGNHRCACHLRTFIQGVFDADDNCRSGQESARLCPWNMNKWTRQSDGNAYVVFVDSSGDWHERRWSLDAADVEDDEYGLNVRLDDWQPTGNASEVSSGGIDMPRFQRAVGSSYGTQLDRVFWSYEQADGGACPAGTRDCVLRRRQCWGRIVDPGTNTWPRVRDGTLRSTTNPDNCGAGDGTGWETIITGLSDFRFRYFADSTTELTGAWTPEKASRTRLIDISFTVQRSAGGRVLRETITRRVMLRNHGGLLGVPLADGGCLKDGC